MAKVVLVFHSTHHVLAAEGVLEAAAIDFDVVPLPDELEAGCGMALEIEDSRKSEVMALIEKEGIACDGVYAA